MDNRFVGGAKCVCVLRTLGICAFYRMDGKFRGHKCVCSAHSRNLRIL